MTSTIRVAVAAAAVTLAGALTPALTGGASGLPVKTPAPTNIPVIDHSPSTPRPTPRPTQAPPPPTQSLPSPSQTAGPSPSGSSYSGPLGAVLIAGCDWAPSVADCSDLNVYGNGDNVGNMQCGGPDGCTYGWEYQCTELVQRYAAHAWGTPNSWGDYTNAYQLWDLAASLPKPLQRFANGGATPPQAGDVIVFNAAGGNTTGHVAVITSVSDGGVTIVEQNSDPSGREIVAREGTTLNGKLPVIGWLRPVATATATQPAPNWPKHLR